MSKTPSRIFLSVILCCVATNLIAQTQSVQTYLQQIAKGWTLDAKKALPDLLLERPDDPGVTFLHASLVEEPAKAVPLYDRIVERFPTSEWADDALMRLIIQACSQKDATRATKYFKQMRQSYSSSDLLAVAYDVMRMSVGAPPAEATPVAAKPTVESKPTKQADTTLPYTLAAVTTPDKAEATKLVSKYKGKHLKADMAEKWIKGKRNYVVQIGYYASETEAATDIETVRKVCGCKPIVTRRMP